MMRATSRQTPISRPKSRKAITPMTAARERIFNINCRLETTSERFILKNISLEMKVKDLKAYCEFITGIPANLQRLCYLDEGDLLDGTDVRHNDMVPGALIHMKVWHTWTTLIEAVVSGDTDWLFALGVTANSDYKSPTCDYMANQHPRLKQEWLAERAFVALFIASHRGNQKLCAKLIESGANVNSHTPYGRSPLHVAAARGHGSIVDLLLENGADIDATDKHGDTPLTVAEKFGNKGCERHLFLFRWQQRAKQTLKNKIQVELLAHQYYDSKLPVWMKGKHGEIYFTQILPPGEFEGTMINSPLRRPQTTGDTFGDLDSDDSDAEDDELTALQNSRANSRRGRTGYPEMMPAIKEESHVGSTDQLKETLSIKSGRRRNKRIQSGKTFDEWLQKKKSSEQHKIRLEREATQRKQALMEDNALTSTYSDDTIY